MVGHMSQPEPAEDWLPTATVAAQLKVSERTVNRWANEGILPIAFQGPWCHRRPVLPGRDVRRLADDRIARFMPDLTADRRRDRHRSSHDVQVGDTVTFLGTLHLITSIEEHPSAISDTGTIRVASGDHGWGITIDASSAVVASTSRPASAGSVVTLDLVAGVVARPRHRRDRPLDPPRTGTAALTPFLPGGLCRIPAPVALCRVRRGPTGRPDLHRWSSLDGDPSWPSIPPPSGGVAGWTLHIRQRPPHPRQGPAVSTDKERIVHAPLRTAIDALPHACRGPRQSPARGSPCSPPRAVSTPGAAGAGTARAAGVLPRDPRRRPPGRDAPARRVDGPDPRDGHAVSDFLKTVRLTAPPGAGSSGRLDEGARSSHRTGIRRLCGGGLHGLLNGAGSGSLINWSTDAVWIVAEIPDDETVVDLDGKVKVRCCIVRHVGDKTSAPEFSPPPTAGHTEGVASGTATAGNRGTATAGTTGTATPAGVPGAADGRGLRLLRRPGVPALRRPGTTAAATGWVAYGRPLRPCRGLRHRTAGDSMHCRAGTTALRRLADCRRLRRTRHCDRGARDGHHRLGGTPSSVWRRWVVGGEPASAGSWPTRCTGVVDGALVEVRGTLGDWVITAVAPNSPSPIAIVPFCLLTSGLSASDGTCCTEERSRSTHRR